MKKILSFLRSHWIFLILFTGIGIVRFMQVPELFVFGIDEEYQSLLAWSQVKDFHPIWIGTSMADTGFYLGPGIVYLHSILLYLSNGDPVILAYAAAILGIVTTAIIFIVSKQFFGYRVGIISMLIYGLSPFMMSFDRRFWNPSMVPLISLLIVYSTVKAYRNDRWWIAVAALMGISTHIHASLFVYVVILPVLLILYLFKKTQQIKLATIFYSVIAFLVFYSPLIIYDLNKNFENLKTPLRLLSRSGSGESGGQFAMLTNTLSQILTTQSNIFISLTIGLIVILGLLVVIRKKRSYEFSVLWLITILFLFLFLMYPGQVHDYYLLGVIPLIIIIISRVLSKVPRLALGILLSIYIVFHLASLPFLTAHAELNVKKRFIQKVNAEIQGQEYYLKTPEPYLKNGGWRYLFQVYGKTPTRSTADEMFGWIYPDEISDNFEITVLVSDTEPQDYTKKITEGPFTAYIIEK